jgi:hypothetical protein
MLPLNWSWWQVRRWCRTIALTWAADHKTQSFSLQIA